MDGILSYAVLQHFVPLYCWNNEEEHLNSTTEHCACIASASPQPHIKTKISKTKRKLVKFRFVCESPHPFYNPKHAITVFTKNRRTTAQKCIKICACAIITFIFIIKRISRNRCSKFSILIIFKCSQYLQQRKLYAVWVLACFLFRSSDMLNIFVTWKSWKSFP